MSEKVVLITGASRGLGKALADIALGEPDTIVVSVSRSVHADHEEFVGRRFHLIQADLSKPFTAAAFIKLGSLVSSTTHLFVFNNAGVISPIRRVGQLGQDAILNSVHVNVAFPVAMIDHLLKSFGDSRISFVDINSGAANKAIANWALYSSAKVYLKMFFSALTAENANAANLSFVSLDPGAIDTGMQDEIRKSDFPQHDYFESLKTGGKLRRPDEAARSIMEKCNFFA